MGNCSTNVNNLCTNQVCHNNNGVSKGNLNVTEEKIELEVDKYEKYVNLNETDNNNYQISYDEYQVTKIQAHMRGFHTRKDFSKKKELNIIHKPESDYAIPIESNKIPKNNYILGILDKIGDFKYNQIEGFDKIPFVG